MKSLTTVVLPIRDVVYTQASGQEQLYIQDGHLHEFRTLDADEENGYRSARHSIAD